ncbi:unnamed protein product [Cyberlindnera jadinii]|uniref:DUF2470 domain-containing protein n=1 Tax=Cyberlindnera jadinii (strain ATCC 18201 / CBS 1600 / BCRC 20928 / JCM 3617 / NBRC 0987 / NRRL Y-1542) TaxID=983966 RepID=A0A0H5CE59_CYBJN|nr:hypothetical protein CYBJADRAFT_30171 [Cyberlindnera jadinii NRRL Y-1542]ODV71662.1 hypothetical protein CYBJADRAFT_30171 [Cyberlindnera jadinii NRRL Y-1542]CEP22874.1 unnamed protein product [Cyberlindnera jadinii]
MAEARILAHMNKDHYVSVEDYLVVYGKVTSIEKVSNVKMTEISLDHMTITFNYKEVEYSLEKVIPFEPPLKDLKEARERLVEMARFAAKERGFSPFQIKDFTYPGLRNRLLISLIYLPAITHFAPDLIINPTVRGFIGDSFGDWLVNNSLNITWLTLGIHALESLFIMRPKLNHFRVPRDYQLEWYVSSIIEGFPAIRRFNKLVEEKTH